MHKLVTAYRDSMELGLKAKVYICVCVCVCVCVCTYYVRMHVDILCVNIGRHIHVFVHVRVYVCMYVSLPMNACTWYVLNVLYVYAIYV